MEGTTITSHHIKEMNKPYEPVRTLFRCIEITHDVDWKVIVYDSQSMNYMHMQGEPPYLCH